MASLFFGLFNDVLQYKNKIGFSKKFAKIKQ